MKIQQAAVNLSSQHHLQEEHIREESLRLWIGDQRPVFEGEEQPETAEIKRSVMVELSEQAMTQSKEQQSIETEPIHGPEIAKDPKLRSMQLVLEGLTGKKIKISQFSTHETAPAPQALDGSGKDQEATPARQGWGMEYDYFESHHEQETMRFNASGLIRTADDQEINFQLDLTMSREFSKSTNIQIRAGDAQLVDPLVINFDGKAIELSEMKFAFDLDTNGRKEEMPFVGPGQGFLFLDRNNDGVANNGLELFGPTSGNGFNELRELDSDANGWLDENDPLFEKLKVWMKDAGDNDYFLSLQEKNVGAILLDTTATPFAMKDDKNSLAGQLRESSIFIKENGTVGAIHEIDLAV